MIRGITVKLVVKTDSGERDAFNNPIETEELVEVSDVLVGQPNTDDINSSIQMYGKTIDYVLGIPKGDTHKWYDTDVIIWGDRYQIIGYPQKGIESNIPLRWGSNVKVKRYG